MTATQAESAVRRATSASSHRTPRTPSMVVSPRRMASEKQTVRLIDVGCGRSHITTCIPAR